MESLGTGARGGQDSALIWRGTSACERRRNFCLREDEGEL